MAGIRWNWLRRWIKVDRELPKNRGHYPDGAIAAISFAECKAAEQVEPGTFDSVGVLVAILDATGARADPPNPRGQWVRFLIEQGEIVVGDDQRPTLPNWRRLQEEGLSTPRVDKLRGRRPGKQRDVKRSSNSDATLHETGMQPLAGARLRGDSSLRSEETTPDGVGDAPIGARDSLEVPLGAKPARATKAPSNGRPNGAESGDRALTRSGAQRQAWLNAGMDGPGRWAPFRREWLALGANFRLPPTDDQAALFREVLVDGDSPEAERLGRWVRESTAKSPGEAWAYVRDRWHAITAGIAASEAAAARQKRALREAPIVPIRRTVAAGPGQPDESSPWDAPA